MVNERIDYPAMIDEAMRSVVRRTLEFAAKQGLPGKHHFYISFNTNFAGVVISPQLHARYPEEMTIVIQHQFWDLRVEDHMFSIMLSFNNIPEKLVIPFAAMTAFADPAIKFGLQFHSRPATIGDNDDMELASGGTEASFDTAMPDISNGDTMEGRPTAEVISLDAFRKK